MAEKKSKNLEEIEKAFEVFVANLEKVKGDDDGHKNLVLDVVMLFKEIVDFEFHDYKNKNYAAPKVVLAARFEDLRDNVIEGKYDNRS